MANLKSIEEKKKKTKKKENKSIDKKQLAKLKKIGGKVLVNDKFKFAKDVDKDPLSLTIKKILLDQICSPS